MDLIPSSRRRWIDLADPEVVEAEEADRATTSPCRGRWRRPRRVGGDGEDLAVIAVIRAETAPPRRRRWPQRQEAPPRTDLAYWDRVRKRVLGFALYAHIYR